MIKIQNAQRDTDGKLSKWAWPGGYPLFYMTEDNAVLCPACANGDNGSDTLTQDDPQWNVVATDANWEDPDLFCEHCNARIESAYAEPDTLTVPPQIGSRVFHAQYGAGDVRSVSTSPIDLVSVYFYRGDTIAVPLQSLQDNTQHVIAEWQSRGGKFMVTLFRDMTGYTYTATDAGGNLGSCDSDAVAIAAMETRIAVGYFQADANKTPMKRTK